MVAKVRLQDPRVLFTVCVWIVFLPISTPISHAEVTTIGECHRSYDECLQLWKQERIEFLKGVDGYLNLAGLYWLSAGANSFGSDDTNDIVFPEGAAESIGNFELQDGKVVMLVNDGVDVRFRGHKVGRMILPDDTTEMPAVITHGRFSWTIIRRDNQFAVRLRDFDNPLLHDFATIDYYPTDLNMRIEAEWQPYEKPRIINVGTVIEGLSYKPQSSGFVRFDKSGRTFELEAYDAAGELFFVFGDRTSGRGTYPAGRFLYAKLPDDNGKVMLDFNTAQNPPCAFNEFATCPVASPRNRIDIRIEAGERYAPAAH